MTQKIFIGNFTKGLTTNRLPFNIDNDAFPTLFNMYSWRGRAKRKRGTIFLGQLERQLQSVTNAAPPNVWQVGQITVLDGSGNGSANLVSLFSLGSTATIVPGSIHLYDGTNTYTEPTTPNGTLVGAPGGSGTINYSTGAITITGGAAAGVLRGSAGLVSFSYYPTLPVMGLREYFSTTTSSQYPLLLAFDTKYAYQFFESTQEFYSVSYYKGSNTPVSWTGQDYQQFWTTNYSAAFWATNNNPGMQFQKLNPGGNVTVGNPTIITTAAPNGLITGDYVWFNEFTGANASSLNGQTAQITRTGATTFTVPINTTAMAINNDGIFQTLTHTSSSGDGIKFYDGDPTNNTGLPTTTATGWVNFAPPLSATTVSINNLTAAQYYLVGALEIVPFKDRLLFFSPWIQTSSGPPINLSDTVIWSWNGTPYYNSLVPSGETYDVGSYYVDQTGRGGWLSAGIRQSISTVNNNEDVLIVGFSKSQARFVYTGDDLFPFLFFTINSELGSSSAFSGISLDQGAMAFGTYGITLTDQQSCQRIDLVIPDYVFQIQGLNNGVQRVSGIRDFFREWIYFSYPLNSSNWKFPTQTFLYNYRDNTWALLYENFTSHGSYYKTSNYTWANLPFSSWATWSESWNSGSTSALFPSIVAGNPQGYVLIKGQGTGEGVSGTIAGVSNSSGNTQIESDNHCVKVNDYLYIEGCLGTTALNTQIGKVISVVDANNFVLDLAFPAGTYLGLGRYSRLSQPILQSKEFPAFWEMGRKTRIGVQKYLFDTTSSGQVTLYIFLSQDNSNAWNEGPIVPDVNSPNNSLIYTTLVYTCPESTNIGLTPANVNLQMPIAESQFQIWHRLNTSLIGDTVQFGITLNDEQMRDLTIATSEIAFHAATIDISPSQTLA